MPNRTLSLRSSALLSVIPTCGHVQQLYLTAPACRQHRIQCVRHRCERQGELTFYATAMHRTGGLATCGDGSSALGHTASASSQTLPGVHYPWRRKRGRPSHHTWVSATILQMQQASYLYTLGTTPFSTPASWAVGWRAKGLCKSPPASPSSPKHL